MGGGNLEIYKPTTNKELSRKKIEEYAKFEKIIRLGRQNPIWFIEEFYGIALMDYQKWMFMESWSTPFVLWLCSRGAGKTVLAAIFLQTKMVLIPDYRVYISTNSAAQSIEVFKKIEDIALQRIPSFRSCTDIFLHEVDKSGNTDTGFIHDPAGHHFRLYNNSELIRKIILIYVKLLHYVINYNIFETYYFAYIMAQISMTVRMDSDLQP